MRFAEAGLELQYVRFSFEHMQSKQAKQHADVKHVNRCHCNNICPSLIISAVPLSHDFLNHWHFLNGRGILVNGHQHDLTLHVNGDVCI